MAAVISTSDLIRDSGVNVQYNAVGQPTFMQIERVFMVTGIPQDTPSNVTAIAIATVQASIPVGTPHPVQAIAKARYYRTMQEGQAHDKLAVVVSYIYSTDGFIDDTWTIESTSFVEQVQTDSEYDDDGNLVPIMVSNYYLNYNYGDASPPAGDSPLPPAAAVLGVLRPRKRLVMTRTIYDAAKAVTLESSAEDYIGCLNLDTFRGGSPDTWLCMDVSVIYEPKRGINTGRLEFVYRPETWNEWVRFSNRQLGVPPNVWKKDTHDKSNGFKQATPYLSNTFADLVALI